MSEAASPSKIVVQIPDKHLPSLWRMQGAQSLLNVLEETKSKSGGAGGFVLALAVAEREVAELRVDWAGRALRIVAAAGHDISNIPAIYTEAVDGAVALTFSAQGDLLDPL
ncbi:hypothetical protein [Microcystis phage Mwe-JY25]